MSLMGDALGQDYRIAGYDRGKTISYVAKREGSVKTFTVELAIPNDYTLQQVAQSKGELSYGDRLWVLGRDQFPEGIKPQTGDTVTESDDGTVWVLFTPARSDALEGRWLCDTRKGRK